MVSFCHYHHLIAEKEPFVTRLLFLVLQLDKKFYEDEESISYTWVREYLWDVRINSATFIAVLKRGENDVSVFDF